MNITTDLHTHTIFSHGKGTILDNAKVARERGLKKIAITDHGYGHHAFGIKQKDLPKMKRLCLEAQSQTGVIVELGVECNILGVDGKTDMKMQDYEILDVYLAGVHKFILYDKFSEWFKLLGANMFARKFRKVPPENLVKRNTQLYINTIKNNPIDVLVHPNFCIFADPVEVAKCCRDYNTLFEIDARKVHMSDEEWAKVKDTGVKFIIDSDAHSPDKIGVFEEAIKMIERVGISKEQIVNVDGKIPENLRFSEFKKHM